MATDRKESFFASNGREENSVIATDNDEMIFGAAACEEFLLVATGLFENTDSDSAFEHSEIDIL